MVWSWRLVGQDLHVGQAAVVVDANVERTPSRHGPAVDRRGCDGQPTDPPELLRVQVQQFAGSLALVAHARAAWDRGSRADRGRARSTAATVERGIPRRQEISATVRRRPQANDALARGRPAYAGLDGGAAKNRPPARPLPAPGDGPASDRPFACSRRQPGPHPQPASPDVRTRSTKICAQGCRRGVRMECHLGILWESGWSCVNPILSGGLPR